MAELIATIIFLGSMVGILFIMATKISMVAQLPENGHYEFKKHHIVLTIEKKFKDFYFDFFHKQIYLHKALSKTRIWVLKLERSIDTRLRGIRKKAQQLDKKVKETSKK